MNRYTIGKKYWEVFRDGQYFLSLARPPGVADIDLKAAGVVLVDALNACTDRELQVAAVVACAREIASMRVPSVEKILRRRGYPFEADRVGELVNAVQKLEAQP